MMKIADVLQSSNTQLLFIKAQFVPGETNLLQQNTQVWFLACKRDREMYMYVYLYMILWMVPLILKQLFVHNCLFLSLYRCPQGDVVTHTAWLNRSSILYAGEEKWSVDPRVSLVTLNQEEFTIKIQNVDMTDEGQYVCAVQTSSRPRTTSVHLLVQGNKQCYH